MGAVIKLIVFVSLSGVFIYFLIFWYAKRNYWKSKGAEATYGKEFADRKQQKQKEKRKSFWKKVGKGFLYFSLGLAAIVLISQNSKRPRKK